MKIKVFLLRYPQGDEWKAQEAELNTFLKGKRVIHLAQSSSNALGATTIVTIIYEDEPPFGGGVEG